MEPKDHEPDRSVARAGQRPVSPVLTHPPTKRHIVGGIHHSADAINKIVFVFIGNRFIGWESRARMLEQGGRPGPDLEKALITSV